jgi:hypothetical protein
MSQKNIVIILAVIIILVLGVLGLYLFNPKMFTFLQSESTKIERDKPKVIDDQLVVPDTKEVSMTQGRVSENGKVETALVPKNEGEKVVVTKAVFTVKGGQELALKDAQAWASDAKLVFVKSMGAITLDGKSSQWQIAFSSVAKKKGYEVIIYGDQVASKKEVELVGQGAELPAVWNDSDIAVKTLQEMPQFSSASISSINFFYNADAKRWRYSIATSFGTTSVTAE